MKFLIFLPIFIAVLLLWTAEWSHAANLPSAKLDAIASEVAGRPESVWCEQDPEAWMKLLKGTWAQSIQTAGFTYPGSPIVYMSPRVCNGLTTAYRGSIEDAGYREFSLSLETLAHEAVHQRDISDEAITECLAMPLVIPLAVKYFGLKLKITRFVLKKGKYIKVLVLNPQVSRIQQWVKYWHSIKPVQYQNGAC